MFPLRQLYSPFLDSMFLLIPLLVVITASAQSLPKPDYDLGDAHNPFKKFIKKHGKVYSPEEYLTRLDIFKKNLERINERNERYQLNEFGINRFTDLTSGERHKFLGFKRFDAASQDRAIKLEYPAEAITAPEQFDWRDHDAVTHVKDQLHCQSSWIFSAIGNIEGQYAINYKKLIAFSEQHGLDCDWDNDRTNNCLEGWPDDLMEYFHSHFQYNFTGVIPENEYPYTGIPAPNTNVKSCPGWVNTNMTHVATVKDYQVLVPKDEETLKQLLYETGPLAVGLDITSIYEYTKGIFVPFMDDCTHEANHAVLLVGYGIENGTRYWILKNSWGEGWGEKGYFRLVRGQKACYMGVSYTATCTVQAV